DTEASDDRVEPTDPARPILSPQQLYEQRRLTLLRAAALMIDNREQAEEVVHDVFAELLVRWPSVDPDRVLGYLYRSVTNRFRSVLRRRRTARAFRADRTAAVPGADESVLQAAGYEVLLAAVRRLPR